MKALVIAIVVSAGCTATPVDEAMEYEQADARIRALEQYELLKQACRAKGGVVHVATNGSRLGPTLFDLRTARCAPRMPSALSIGG